MKIINSNLSKGEIKIKVENPDDLWYLSQAIDSGDIIQGKTVRKIKTNSGKSEESSSSEKRSIFLSIQVERIEFHKYASQLRVSGQVNEITEDVPKGSYHTFDLEVDSIITIQKERWPKYQLDRIKEASLDKAPSIIICVFDREEVLFAQMKSYGYEILSEYSGDVEKKVNGKLQKAEKAGADFYSEIIKTLEEYDKRLKPDSIILASPAFWKDELIKALKDNPLKKKVYGATCSSVTKNAIDEVLKRDEVKKVLQNDRAAKESSAVEKLFVEISKSAQATYGIVETRNAAELGAIEKLLVTDGLIQKTREKGSYFEIEKIMKKAEASQGEVMIISSENDAGKKLDGLGGIGSILRYKLNYS